MLVWQSGGAVAVPPALHYKQKRKEIRVKLWIKIGCKKLTELMILKSEKTDEKRKRRYE